MGNCCHRNLIAVMDNKTRIYFIHERNLKHKKTYKIQLEGDLYKICPNKTSITQTHEMFKSQGDLLTFLKDEKGIRTDEHRIRKQLQKCLEQIDNEEMKCVNLIFQQPKVNDDNKIHLFKCLAGSIYRFDINKDKHYLKNIYIPWRELGIETLRDLISEQINHLTFLVPKG